LRRATCPLMRASHVAVLSSASCAVTSPFISSFVLIRRPPTPTLFPYTTLFRSARHPLHHGPGHAAADQQGLPHALVLPAGEDLRSEEHTSELQSRFDLVCRLLLEKKN